MTRRWVSRAPMPWLRKRAEFIRSMAFLLFADIQNEHLFRSAGYIGPEEYREYRRLSQVVVNNWRRRAENARAELAAAKTRYETKTGKNF